MGGEADDAVAVAASDKRADLLVGTCYSATSGRPLVSVCSVRVDASRLERPSEDHEAEEDGDEAALAGEMCLARDERLIIIGCATLILEITIIIMFHGLVPLPSHCG
jgi:hypothetical protein